MSVIIGGGVLQEELAKERRETRERKIAESHSAFAYEHSNRFLRAVWPFAALGVLIVGVAVDEIIISLVAAAVLVGGIIAWAWTRWSLERLWLELEPSQTHAFVGETLELGLRLENRKLLPLTSLQVRINLPDILEPSNQPFSKLHEHGPGEGVVVRSTAMRWYERLRWRFRIPLRTRGYFQLAAVDLKASDIFGIYRRERTDDPQHTLWVYPEVVALERLSLPQLRPQGERRGGQALFEDPTRLQTIRDYRAGDPLKKVDWKATARRQQLQSRVYDPSTDLVAVVALNVSTLPHAWQGFFGDIFERAVSVAASIAADWSEQRAPVGLLANCTYPGRDTAIRVSPSRAPGQMTHILEALSMADVFTLVRIERMLNEERLPYGSTVALITAVITPELEVALQRLVGHGIELSVVYVGIPDPPATVAGAVVHDIRNAIEHLHFERVGENGPWARSERLWGDDAEAPPEPGPETEVDLPLFVEAGAVSDSDGVEAPRPAPRMPQPIAAAAAAPDSPWSRPPSRS